MKKAVAGMKESAHYRIIDEIISSQIQGPKHDWPY